MSIRIMIATVVVCDGPGHAGDRDPTASFSITRERPDAPAAREMVADRGWLSKDGKDFCPYCSGGVRWSSMSQEARDSISR